MSRKSKTTPTPLIPRIIATVSSLVGAAGAFVLTFSLLMVPYYDDFTKAGGSVGLLGESGTSPGPGYSPPNQIKLSIIATLVAALAGVILYVIVSSITTYVSKRLRAGRR